VDKFDNPNSEYRHETGRSAIVIKMNDVTSSYLFARNKNAALAERGGYYTPTPWPGNVAGECGQFGASNPLRIAARGTHRRSNISTNNGLELPAFTLCGDALCNEG